MARPVTVTARQSAPAVPPVRHRGLFLALMCSVQFILLVGGTVVVVSLPAIRADLDLAPAQLQWVLTAFSLTFGCLLLLGGRSADVFGRRRLFLAGLFVFTLGSLLCAVASDAGLLIAARAFAGIGAAMASPAAMSLLTTVFVEPRERSSALGTWAAIGAFGATLGNVIGGVLTDMGGWRWIFLVNVPVCLLAFAVAFFVVPAIRPEHRQRLDAVGGLLVTLGVAALILGLTELQVYGPEPRTWITLAAAAVLVGLFVLSQARGADPLLPLGIFRYRTSFAFLFVLLTAGVGIGAYFTTSLFMQETLGWSALRAGFAFVPWAATVAVTARLVSRNTHRVGPRLLVPAGLVLCAAGAALLAVAMDGSTGYAGGLLVPFLLLGLGSGAINVTCTVTALSGIPGRRHGVGAGALNSTQALGGTLSIAVVAVLTTLATERALAGGGSLTVSTLAGQRFALLVVAGVALAGAVLAAVVLPSRLSGPAQDDEDVLLARPPAAPLP
ncbi:MFS transporter [Geodermatophilus sp. SYSU D00705]